MKLFHIIIIFSVGFIAGSLLIFVFGDDGIAFYSRLSRHREVLEKNIEDLKKKNGELNSDVESLKTDPEKIRVLARKLGYYRTDEKLILLNKDLSTAPHYEIGTLVKQPQEKTGRNIILRIAGFMISFFAAAAIFLFKRLRNKT